MRVRVSFEPLLQDLKDPASVRVLARALILAAGAGAFVAFEVQASRGFLWGVLAGLGAGLAAFLLTSWVIHALIGGAARGIGLFVDPSLPSDDDFSLEKSLLTRGAVDDALAAIEVRLGDGRENPALLFLAAEACARQGGRPRRAEVFFLRARRSPSATPEDDFRATHRLIDLYQGPLANPTRAAEELTRLHGRHPATNAARARSGTGAARERPRPR